MPQLWVLDRLYTLADAQVGHFTAGQAEELGVDRRYLTHHVRSGNLERVDRGIYRLRKYPSHRFEDVMVAILWVGRGAVASHATALAMYDLADAMPVVIHITVDRRFRGNRRGVIVHQGRLDERDVTRRDGVPVTTPLRTIIDVAPDQSVAMAAATEAVERGLIRASQLRDASQEQPQLAEIVARMPSG